MAFIDKTNVAFFWENRFLLKELAFQKGAVVIPLPSGTAGLSFSRFGFELYNENSFALAYGMKMSDKFCVGFQLNYLWRFIADNYGKSKSLIFEIGFIAIPADEIYLGLHLFNPTLSGFNDYENDLGSVEYRLAAGIGKHKNLFSEIEVSGDLHTAPCLKLKLDYYLLKNVCFLSGFQTDPNGFFFGAGFIFNDLKIDIGFCTHTILGISPRLCLSYGI